MTNPIPDASHSVPSILARAVQADFAGEAQPNASMLAALSDPARAIAVVQRLATAMALQGKPRYFSTRPHVVAFDNGCIEIVAGGRDTPDGLVVPRAHLRPAIEGGTANSMQNHTIITPEGGVRPYGTLVTQHDAPAGTSAEGAPAGYELELTHVEGWFLPPALNPKSEPWSCSWGYRDSRGATWSYEAAFRVVKHEPELNFGSGVVFRDVLQLEQTSNGRTHVPDPAVPDTDTGRYVQHIWIAPRVGLIQSHNLSDDTWQQATSVTYSDAQ